MRGGIKMKQHEEREQVLKVAQDILKNVRERGRPRLHCSENGKQLGMDALNRWNTNCDRLNTLVEKASAVFANSNEKVYWIADEEIKTALDYACLLQEKYLGK
jgi:hypothetical protein